MFVQIIKHDRTDSDTRILIFSKIQNLYLRIYLKTFCVMQTSLCW